MDLQELFIRIFGDDGPFSVGRYDDFRKIFMSGFPGLRDVWEEDVPNELSIAIYRGIIPAADFLKWYHEKDPSKKEELQKDLEEELEKNKEKIDEVDTSENSAWDGWKAGLLGLAGIIPSFLTSIISDKKIQDAYDKYFNAENEAIDKALNLNYATYLHNQKTLSPFVNAGVHATNAYMHSLGFPSSMFTRPTGLIDFSKVNFNNGTMNFGNGGDDPPPNDIFPPDFWGNGVYKNIGEGDDVPQKGMDALAIQYWGKDKDGHGGIMGAVLGGDLTINQARHLSIVMWKDWIKDMVDSGVSKEDITKSVNDQKGFMHMMTNLRKISGMDSDGGTVKNWVNLTIDGEAREFQNFNLSTLPIKGGDIDREYYNEKGEVVSYPFVDDYRITNGQQILDAGDKEGNSSGRTLNDASIDSFIDWVQNTADIPEGYALRHLFGFEPTYKEDSEGNITLVPSLEDQLIKGNWWAALPRAYKFPNDIFVRGYDQYLKDNRSPGYGVQWNYSNPYGFGIRFSSKPVWWDDDLMGTYDNVVRVPKNQSGNNNKYSNFINGIKGATAPPDWDIDKVWNEYDPGKKTEKSLLDALELAEEKISGKDKEQLKSEFDQAVQNLASQGIVPEEFTSEFEVGSEDYLKELQNWTTNLADQTGYEGYDPDWEDKFTKDFVDEFNEESEAHKRGLLRDMSMYPPGLGMGPDDTRVQHPVTGETRSDGMSRLLGVEANNWKGANWFQGGRFEVDPSTMELIHVDTGESAGYFYPDETGWRLTKDAPTLTEQGRWIAPSNARMNEHQGIPRWILNGKGQPGMPTDPLLDGLDPYDFVPQYNPDEFLEKTGFTINEWFSGVKDGKEIPQEELEAAQKNIPSKRFTPTAENVFEQYRKIMKENPDLRYQINIAHLAARPDSKYGFGPLAWPVEESRFLELGHQWRQVLQDEWDAKGRDNWINQRIEAEKSNNKSILENQKQRLDSERIRIQELLNAASAGRQEDIDAANTALELFNEERDDYQEKLNDFVSKEAARKTRIGVAQENINEYNTEWGDFLKQSQMDFKSSYYGDGDPGDGTGKGDDTSDVNTNGVGGSNKLTDDEYFDGIKQVKLDPNTFKNLPVFSYDNKPVTILPFDYKGKPSTISSFDYKGDPKTPGLGYGGKDIFRHPLDYPTGRDPLGREGSPYEQRSGMLDPNGDPYFDPSEVPQAGANQASELIWGGGEQADGRGGIMGAVLAGTIDFNEALRIADNIEKSWEEDMKASGVLEEELAGLKEQLNPGFQFLRNNINNLEDFGGIELGGKYYDGFEVDADRGRVVNGRDILQPQGFDLITEEQADPITDWIKSAEGTIDDPYNIRMTPKYQYMLRHGGKKIQRHLQSIGNLRSTAGMNTYNQYIDKILGDAEQETFERRRDRATELYTQQKEVEKEKYDRALEMWKTTQSAEIAREKDEYARAQKQFEIDLETAFKTDQERFRQRQVGLENLRNLMNIGATSASSAAGQGGEYSNIISQLMRDSGSAKGTSELGKGLSGSEFTTSLGDFAGKGYKDLLKALGLG